MARRQHAIAWRLFVDVTLNTWLATGIIMMPLLSSAILFAKRDFSAYSGLIGATGSGLSLALGIGLLIQRVDGVQANWQNPEQRASLSTMAAVH